MTLGYMTIKAKSKGQTHYFSHSYAAGSFFPTDHPIIQRNAEVALRNVTKRIQEALGDQEAIVERCHWDEWDNVPRHLKHII